MSAEERPPTSDGPRPRRRGWLIALAAVAVLAIAAALVLARPLASGAGGQEPSTRLSVADPAMFHPDGLVLRLRGDGVATVTASTLPREALLRGETGTAWEASLQAAPGHLIPLSPLYRFRVQDAAVQAELAVPNDARPVERLSIYGWDDAARRWIFVPSQLDEAQQVLIADAPPGEAAWMVFRADPPPPVQGVVVPPGAAAPPEAGLVLLGGLSVGPGGALTGEPAAAPGGDIPVLLLVDGRAAELLPAGEWAAPLAAELGARAATASGVVLDLPLSTEGYGDLLAQVRTALPPEASLGVVVRPAEVTSERLVPVAQAADTVWLAVNDPTAAAEDGAHDRALAALTGRVDRARVGLLVSGGPVAVSAAGAQPLTLAEAAAQAGTVQAVPGYLQPEAPLAAPRGEVPVQVSGPLLAMGTDEALGASYLALGAGAGDTVLLYAPAAAALARQAEWAARYGLGLLAIDDSGVPETPASPQFVWRVTDTTGAMVDEHSGGLSAAQWVWGAPRALGTYTISGALQFGGAEVPLGEIAVDVTEHVPAADSTGGDAP